MPACLADPTVLSLLLYTGLRPGRSPRGAWTWVAGVPLLGPTVYVRYDLMVTAVAVAALLAGARHPRVPGAPAGLGALLKVWPALLLVGATRLRAWASAAVTAGGLGALFAPAVPGGLGFLAFQRDRGTEVESPGGPVFPVAWHFGRQGEVLLNHGSIEFLGPYVGLVSSAAMALTGAAFGRLVLWRLRAARLAPHTLAEAAFTAVLLFTVTSRVISPQYLVRLIGLAAVCLCFRSSRMGAPASLLLAAALLTVLEFPVGFVHVAVSDPYGVTLLLRNGLPVAAALRAARELWRCTVPAATVTPLPPQATRAKETSAS
ncbi:membrane protein [Streptomyces cellostaticus]|nr:membrane protein [Streptomyces cellostaticus]